MINFAVLHKELRQKLQGWMAFSILCGYLLIAAIITFFVIIINKKTLLCEIGNSLTLGLFIFQSFAIMLISITLASIMISQERGKQTYETLLSSPVSRLNIIFGKLAAHWFFLSAVVISVFGPGAICILLGGVNLTDLLALYLILLMSALLWGAFGIYFSSIFKKTYSAIFVAVIFILAMLFATGIFAEIKGISAFFFPFSAGWAISKHTEFFWFNIKIPLLPIFIFIQFVIISLLINESVRRLYLKDLKIFSVIRKSLWAGLWIFSLVLSLGFADTLMRSGWGLFGGIIAKQYIFLLIISIVSLPVICGGRQFDKRMPRLTSWIYAAILYLISSAIIFGYYFTINPGAPSLSLMLALFGLVLLQSINAGLCGIFGSLCFKNNVAAKVTAFVLTLIFLSLLPVTNIVKDNWTFSQNDKNKESLTSVFSAVSKILPTNKNSDPRPIKDARHLFIFLGITNSGMLAANLVAYFIVVKKRKK